MQESKNTIRKMGDIGFAQIPNHVIENPLISDTAKWLYCYILSKPDWWEFHNCDIMKHTTSGRDRVNNAFKELIAHGLITREEKREGGRFAGYTYSVFLKPQTEKPYTANQFSVTQVSENNTDSSPKRLPPQTGTPLTENRKRKTVDGSPLTVIRHPNNTNNNNTNLNNTNYTPLTPQGGTVVDLNSVPLFAESDVVGSEVVEQKPVRKTKKQTLEYDPKYLEFYQIYPRQDAKAAGQVAYFKAVKVVDHDTLCRQAAKYAALCQGKEKQYIALPASWLSLNSRRWEDTSLEQLPSTHAQNPHAQPQQQAPVDYAARKALQEAARKKWDMVVTIFGSFCVQNARMYGGDWNYLFGMADGELNQRMVAMMGSDNQTLRDWLSQDDDHQANLLLQEMADKFGLTEQASQPRAGDDHTQLLSNAQNNPQGIKQLINTATRRA